MDTPRMRPDFNEIIQYEAYGIVLSFNPDDDRFYISEGDEQIGNYGRWSRAAAVWRKKVAEKRADISHTLVKAHSLAKTDIEAAKQALRCLIDKM